jgi:hypothetical protein
LWARSFYECGGTLIKLNTVLTSAQCVSPEFKFFGDMIFFEPNERNPTFESTFSVYLGVHNSSFINFQDKLPENAIQVKVKYALWVFTLIFF